MHNTLVVQYYSSRVFADKSLLLGLGGASRTIGEGKRWHFFTTTEFGLLIKNCVTVGLFLKNCA